MEMLKEDEFNKVLPILNQNKTSPTFAYSIIERIISGMVFVDNSDCPKTALIGTKIGIYFIAGHERNSDFNRSFRDFYEEEIGDRFTLFSATKVWDHVICNLFKDEISQMDRYSYTFNKKKYLSNVIDIPKDYHVKMTDKDIIENSPEFNKDYYKQYWGSVSNFLANGIGVSALYKGRIVSECTSIFRSNSFVEIDIATQTEFTGKGLAYILGKTFIDECLEKGIIPNWDCDVANISSRKLAEKLGFDSPIKYSIFVRRR